MITLSLPCSASVLGGQVLSSLTLCIVLSLGPLSIGQVFKDSRGSHSNVVVSHPSRVNAFHDKAVLNVFCESPRVNFKNVSFTRAFSDWVAALPVAMFSARSP